MYEIVRNVSELLFIGIAGVAIISGIIRMRSKKKDDKK